MIKMEKCCKISIHALREEGDIVTSFVHMTIGAISIHALREEGDTGMELRAVAVHQFLSTPSARRATLHVVRELTNLKISIHALREEGDFWHLVYPPCFLRFLSTPSARRATICDFMFSNALSHFYPRPP